MPDHAWATYVVTNNYSAILSEAGRSFDRAFLEAWVNENGEGFFVRDKSSPLDCCLFPVEDFFKLYKFQADDPASLFRLIIKR